MRKAILLADLHLHHLPVWRLEWCENFMNDLLSEFGGFTEPHSHSHKLTDDLKTDLYILGDVIEIRDKVDSRVLNLLIKLITKWSNGDVVWISGQHDSYIPGKATLHGLDGITLPNGRVIVVDNHPYNHIDNIWFVPFQRRDEDYREKLALVPDDSIVLTHTPTKEIIEMYGAKDVEGISIKEFERFKLAISGDIHKFYDFPELSYVGAPSQRDWRDSGVEGRFGILEGGKFSRMATEHPKHIKVKDASEIPPDGVYIIKTARGANIQAANVIETVETSDLKMEHLELTASGTMEDSIKAYVAENPPPITETDQTTITFASTFLGDKNE